MGVRGRTPRVGLFLMAGDMTGGGGAERQFADTYDAFQQRTGPLDVWLVTDRFTLRHLRAVGRPRSEARLMVLRSLGDVRGRRARRLRTLWRQPGEWIREFGFKCGRRLEHLLLVVQCFAAALRFDLIHIALLRRFFPPFLRALARLPASIRPRISLSVVDCRLAHSLLAPGVSDADLESHLELFREVRPDGVLSWYELFKSAAERLNLFPKRTVLHAARYCFVDLSRCGAAEKKDRAVVFAGRLAEVKQPLMFIEAVRLLLEKHEALARDWTFAMYGQGELEPAVRARLKESGIEGRMALGWSGNMPAVFARSRLFVSTQDFENFTSLAMLEAMACGNAIVARDVGQTRRFVEDGVNGCLARDDTAGGVADAIARYLAAPERHDRMQAESIRLATVEHTVEHFMAEIEDYWLRVLAPGAASPPGGGRAMTLDSAGLARQSSIRGRLRFLFKDSALYGGATAVARLLSIFTVPILARLFSRAEFGVVDAVAVLGMVFVPLMTMGQDSAVARFFYEMEDERERREVMSQSLAFELAMIGACTAVLFAFTEPLMRVLLSSAEHAPAFRVVVLSLPFQVLLNFGQNILKWTFNRGRFLFVSIGSVALTVGLTLVFVVLLRRGVMGVFYAQLVSRVVFAVVGMSFCRRWFVRPAHYRYLAPMLKFGWPYMLLGVSGCLMPMIDRYFIVNRMSLEAMGLYAAGAKLAMLIQLPIQGFQTAWGPFAFAIYKDPKASRTYDAVLLCYTAVLCLVGYLLVALARPLLLVLVSSKFLESRFLVLPLVFALIVDSLSWITGIGIDISKKTYTAAISYVTGVAVTAAAMAALVGPFGLLGAAYAVVIGRLALTVVKTFLAHRLYPLPFNYARPAGLILAAFGMSLAADRYLPFAWQAGPVAVRLLFAAVLAGLAYRLLAASRREGARAPGGAA